MIEFLKMSAFMLSASAGVALLILAFVLVLVGHGALPMLILGLSAAGVLLLWLAKHIWDNV